MEWKCQPVSQIQPLSPKNGTNKPTWLNREQGPSSSVIEHVIPTQYPTKLFAICSSGDSPLESLNLFLWAVMDLSLDSGDNLTGHSFWGRRVGIRFCLETRKLTKSDFSIKVMEPSHFKLSCHHSSKWLSGNCG